MSYRPCILVVDDTPENIQILAHALTKEYEVRVSTNGLAALEFLREHGKPDLILLDIMMPDMDGYEVCRQIKANPAHRDIPVIFLTAMGDARSESAGLALGAVDYITKPINIDITRLRIHNHLERERLHRRIAWHCDQLEELVRERTQALSESELRYRLVADFTYDWELWLSPDGDVMYTSPSCERITGFTPSDFVTDPGLVERIIYSDDLGIWHSHAQQMAAGTLLESHIFFRIITKSGDIRWIEHVCQPVVGDDGAYLGRRISHSDITSRKQQEEELRHKDAILSHQSRLAAMGEMLGNIAHQWRQPLTAMSLVIQNLNLDFRDGCLDEERMTSYSKKAQSLVEQMSTTIDQFRDFFNPNRPQVQFPLKKVLNQCADLLAGTLKAHKITLSIDVPDNIVLFGHPGELSQVFLNLISNAKDAIVERKIPDGRISIQVAHRGDCIIVLAEDNAGGIPSNIVAKVFEPYFTTKEKGTGIGLYMCRTIIEKHFNGEIHVQNVPGGALFSVTLPTTVSLSAKPA